MSVAMPKGLIVGIGNEIRCDDAVGLHVANAVGKRLKTSSRYVVKTLNAGGWQLLHEIEGFDRLVVVDAFFSECSHPGREGSMHPVKSFRTEIQALPRPIFSPYPRYSGSRKRAVPARRPFSVW